MKFTQVIFRVFFIVCSVLLSSQDVFAQNDDCFKLLVPNVSIKTSSMQESLAFAEQIDEYNYEEAKKSVKTKATVLVSGFTGFFEGNYDEFKKKHNQYKKTTVYISDSKKNEAIFISLLSDKLAEKIVTCKHDIKKNGIVIYPIKITKEYVTINFRYTDPRGMVGKVTHLDYRGINMSNTENTLSDLNRHSFLSGSEINFTFNRKPKEDFLLSISVSGTTDLVDLPYFVKPKEVLTDIVVPIQVYLCSGGDCNTYEGDMHKVRWEESRKKTSGTWTSIVADR